MKELTVDMNGQEDPSGSFDIPIPDDYESSAPPAGSAAVLSGHAQNMLSDRCGICSADQTGIKLEGPILSGPYITLTGEQCDELNQWAEQYESV